MENEAIGRLNQKLQSLGENPDSYIEGLYHSNPLTYWDYTLSDTLLSLQRPKTAFPDETIFILYSQLTELYLKGILHELKQVCLTHQTPDTIETKIGRCNTFLKMLIDLFKSIKKTIEQKQYHAFRNTLTPASGFQSVQFRYIEFYATRIQNLTENKNANDEAEEEIYKRLYWRLAGIDTTTGARTLTLKLFEQKYRDELIALARKIKGQTLEDKILTLKNLPESLNGSLKHFDYLFNVVWPHTHLAIAKHFLKDDDKYLEATGNSKWTKYLHPKYQQRIFFPTLWSMEEINHWGMQKQHFSEQKSDSL